MFASSLRRFLAFFLAGLALLTGGQVLALAQAGTTVRLDVFGSLALVIPSFDITPTTFEQNETDLVATTGALRYSNGDTATGITCEFIFTVPDASTLTLNGVTDQDGRCEFRMNQPLNSQGLTLGAGNVASLTATLGQGQGYVEYTFENAAYPTNVDTYTVVDPLVPLVPNVTVTPAQVYLQETLAVSLPTVRFDDNTVAVGLSCALEITAPDQTLVVLRGLTDSNGQLQYDSSQTLAAQGLTLENGDVTRLSATLGQGRARAVCLYDGTSYPSPDYTLYEVIQRPLTLQTPAFTITPEKVKTNEELEFRADPLLFSDASVAVGVSCTLVITSPNGNTVTLTNQTNAQGVCRYRTDNLEDWTVASGDLADVKVLGNGSAFIRYAYDNLTYPTNVDVYEVHTEPVVPNLQISPSQVYPNEPIVVTLPAVVFENGTVAAGLMCELTLTDPAQNTLTFTGRTDLNGTIRYDSARPLTDQGLTLVGGDPALLTASLGAGSGRVSCFYARENYPSPDQTPYAVVPRPVDLVVPPFAITPPQIRPSEDLTFAAEALRNSNGDVVAGISCSLIITTPLGTTVTLTSQTDSQGVCAYATANPAGWAVVSGSVGDIKALGSGSAYIEYAPTTGVLQTSPDTYEVISEPLTLTVPNLQIDPAQVYLNEPIVTTLPPVTFSNQTLAVGLECTLTLTSPNQEQLTFTGRTDLNGTIRYDSARPLTDQGLTLVGGDPALLTASLGAGQGEVACDYNGVSYSSPEPAFYTVISRPVDVRIPEFSVNPAQITPTEELVFASAPFTLTDGAVLANVPCILVITTPANTAVSLSSTTNGLGECAYATGPDLNSQNWTLLAGVLSEIKALGNGSAYVQLNYNDRSYQTNVDTYRVVSNDPILAPLTFAIDPEEIELGEGVDFTLLPVIDSNGQVRSGLACTLNLLAPDLEKVTVTGTTDANGECRYQALDQTALGRLRSLWSLRASANVAVQSGDPLSLNTVEGRGSGFAEVEFAGATVLSNVDTYAVVAQLLEEDENPVPTPELIPEFVVETVRTGGALGLGVVGLGFAFVFSLFQTFLPFWRTRDKSE